MTTLWLKHKVVLVLIAAGVFVATISGQFKPEQPETMELIVQMLLKLEN